MNDGRQILVVARDPQLAERLIGWLEESGREATLAASFADAGEHLAARPSLVITELKLGEYNGLHLALKAFVAGIPAIVIGPEDPVLRRDADKIHAAYLTAVSREIVLETIARLHAAPAAPRRAVLPFRARVIDVPAESAARAATSADVSWRAFLESHESTTLGGRTN